MAATKAQCKFIDDLIKLGADIPCDSEQDTPDFSMYDSVTNADAYIKKWQYLLRRVPTTKLRADEWGGISNC